MLNEESVRGVTFCPLRLMGLLQSCLEEEDERIEKGREEESGGCYCIAQHNSVSRGGGTEKDAGGFTFAAFSPLFYISIVFGQAQLYMRNYQ